MKFKVGRLGICFFVVGVIFANFPPDTDLGPGLREFDTKVAQVLYALAFFCWTWMVADVIEKAKNWSSKLITNTEAEQKPVEQ